MLARTLHELLRCMPYYARKAPRARLIRRARMSQVIIKLQALPSVKRLCPPRHAQAKTAEEESCLRAEAATTARCAHPRIVRAIATISIRVSGAQRLGLVLEMAAAGNLMMFLIMRCAPATVLPGPAWGCRGGACRAREDEGS
jgi:hypothetical protein